LGEYVEFAEKQDIVTMINLLNEIEQVSKEINVILGFSKMWGRSEEMVSIQEIDEEIKWVVGEIERKTREKASIIERMKK